MPRRISTAARVDVRGERLTELRARAAKPVVGLDGRVLEDRYHAAQLADLEAGRPIVVAGWQLVKYLPALRRRHRAYYRLEPDGRVVEVVARRDPTDRMSIAGWDVVEDV